MEGLVSKMNLRRRTEDVDYWRKQAGWFDDDVSMSEFNQGVYGTSGGSSGDDGFHMSYVQAQGPGGLATLMKLGATVLSVVFLVLLYRALSRRNSSRKKVGASAKHSGTADTKSRTRSRSRSSRSRSRSRRHGTSSGNYELMEDNKSDRSKRSRSRSRRRSKSKSRSSSKARSKKTKEAVKEPAKEVLV